MRQWVARWTQGAVVVITGLACAPAAHAGSPPPTSMWPVGDERGVFPPIEFPYLQVDVVPVGDVNGDGVDDLAVENRGRCLRIVFRDPSERAPIPICEDDAPGFRITEPRAIAPKPVGDLDHDGLADISVGDWIMFGKRDSADVDGEALRAHGLTIEGRYWSDQILGIGDQNGDGVRDLAIANSDGVTVLYTPSAPAGATVSQWRPGTGGYRLLPNTASHLSLFAGNLGDANGDGVDDLAVATQEGDDGFHATVRVYGVYGGASPGTSVDLRTVAAARSGFEFRVDDAHVKGLNTIGDQNGDGRRDIAVFVGAHRWLRTWLFVPFTPDPGTVADLSQITPEGRGYQLYPLGDQALDVGDQDGDGIADLASAGGVIDYVTPTDAQTRATAPYYHDTPGVMFFEGSIVGSVGDADGDGRREIVTKTARSGSTRAVYDILYSHSRAPYHWNEAGHPVYLADGRLRSDVIFDWNGAAGDAWTQVLRVWDPRGDREWQTAGSTQPAGKGRFWFSVAFRAADAFGGEGLEPGQNYYWSWEMRRDDGRTGQGGGWTQFVYDPANHPPPGTPDPEPTIATSGPGRPPGAGLRGTNGRDRLIGTPKRDRLRGLGGADVIDGRAANDVVDGGSGNDRITGGAGADKILGGTGADRIVARDGKRDVVDCGAGRDTAVVDRRDRIRHCERVRRR